MRILLDSRDLINLLERRTPFDVNEYSRFLRDGEHVNVLSFTNVREMAAPLSLGAEFMSLRPRLQSLEALPTEYLRETTLMKDELAAALIAFTTGTEYRKPNLYVRRWDSTMSPVPGRDQQRIEGLVNLRLDEIVYLTYRGDPQVFLRPRIYIDHWRKILEEDRKLLQRGQLSQSKHFIRSIRNHATRHNLTLPAGREDEFGAWIYQNPRRCEGIRLNHEMYRLLLSNKGDIPEASDFSDLAHVFVLPYVDAATLDRRMRHYVRTAAQKMLRPGAEIDIGARVYENLTDIVTKNSMCE